MSSTPPIPVISSASIKNIDVVTATVITHIFVHVISVLGVIDVLFAAVSASSNRAIHLIDFSTVALFLRDERAKGRRAPPYVSSHKGKTCQEYS